MNQLASALGWLVQQFVQSPLLASVVGTALALAIATATSRAVYKFLQALCQRISPGPLFLSAASTLALVYAVLLAYLFYTDRSFEQGVIDWVTGITGTPIDELGTYRNPLLIGLFYLVFQILYLLIVLALAWLLGFFSRGEQPGGVARAVEEELGTRFAERMFKLCGYHRADAPEQRFAEYGRELHRAMRYAVWLSLPAAVTGAVPVALWVVLAIVVDGFKRNLTPPPEAPEEEEREADAEQAELPPVRDPNQLVHALRADPRGPQLNVLAGGTLQGRPEHLAGKTRVKGESELVKDILAALEIEGFYVHQEAAAEAIVGGKDVLMETPPVSGRRTLCDVLAMRSVLLEGGTVLYLSPDRAESARRAAAFRQLASQSGWRWAIFRHDLAAAGREGLDLKLRQPQILFATPEELHGDVCPHHVDWDFFLRNLALIVTIDLDSYAGAAGSNLAYLMRRLARVCTHVGAEPRVLATVAPYGPDVQSFAERLVARPLSVIGPESNSRGAPTQWAVLGESTGAPTLHAAVSSRGVAIACGYHGEIWGYDDVLSSFEQQQQVNKVLLAFSRAVVSTAAQVDLRIDTATALVVRMSSATAAMLPFFTCHAGRAALGVASFSAQEVGERAVDVAAPELPFSGFARPEDEDEPPAEPAESMELQAEEEPSAEQADPDDDDDDPAATASPAEGAQALGLQSDMVVSVWIPDGDAFARLLAQHPNWVHPAGLHSMMKLGSSLVASADNPTIALRHLESAARETPLDMADASADFPQAVLAAALGGDDNEARLVERPRLRLSRDGTIDLITELAIDGLADRETSTEVASDETARVVNRAGNETVLQTDRQRILLCAYPGRVLVRAGRRYRVLLPEEQGRVNEAVVWAEPERRRIRTARIREIHVEFEGHGHELRLGGGAKVRFHHPAVTLRETVLGVRQAHEKRRLADMIRYDEPIEAAYGTRAAIVHLAAASGPALEALELLLRITLPAFVHHSEDDLDVACSHGDEPKIVFVDRHPGGVGFARAVTSAVLRHALYWSRELVVRCGRSDRCREGDGCVDCIGGAPRFTPEERPQPSRTAVAALLEELLGPRDDAVES